MGQILSFGKIPRKKENQFKSRRQVHAMMPKNKNKVITGIYKLNFNEKFYIGRSNNIKNRLKHHIKEIENSIEYQKAKGSTYSDILSFMNKNPKFSIILVDILEECKEESLNEKEQFWINKYLEDNNLINTKTIATKTSRDIKIDNFKSGVYLAEFKIDTFEQYVEYKKIVSNRMVLSHGIKEK
jgi:hypothetical protein